MADFLNIKLNIGESEQRLIKIAEKKLGGKVGYFKILKKSLDARDKGKICYVYNFTADIKPPPQEKPPVRRVLKKPQRVIIAGSGPCGLFCALELAERGISSVIVERGSDTDRRIRSVDSFFKGGELNGECNIQFGEGGAGTFSDGKLNTGTKNPLNKRVLELFVKFGAPEEILYLSKPHIGSDNLVKVVKNIRAYLEEQGCEFRFDSYLSDIKIKDNAAYSAVFKSGREEAFSELVLAIGHSSRDTYSMLYSSGVALEQKEFAVGFRIEHAQSFIDAAQYGKIKGLPPADYKLVSHAGSRDVFTFCMCPGGYVVAAASEKGGVVTNGMSNYRRDAVNANSAVIAQVKKSDFSSDSPLAGIEFQRKLERRAFELGGGDYKAPVQAAADFAKVLRSQSDRVLPTYARGTNESDLRELFPEPICGALADGLIDMDKKIKGFMSNAVITAVESRTSSPVRILRGGDMQSVNIKNLYPAGEGAGYAGGITSSAADGLRCATAIADKYM